MTQERVGRESEKNRVRVRGAWQEKRLGELWCEDGEINFWRGEMLGFDKMVGGSKERWVRNSAGVVGKKKLMGGVGGQDDKYEEGVAVMGQCEGRREKMWSTGWTMRMGENGEMMGRVHAKFTACVHERTR